MRVEYATRFMVKPWDFSFSYLTIERHNAEVLNLRDQKALKLCSKKYLKRAGKSMKPSGEKRTQETSDYQLEASKVDPCRSTPTSEQSHGDVTATNHRFNHHRSTWDEHSQGTCPWHVQRPPALRNLPGSGAQPGATGRPFEAVR